MQGITAHACSQSIGHLKRTYVQVPGVHLAHAMQDSMSDAASECSTSGQDHMQDMMMGTPANAHQLLALAESTGMDWKVCYVLS